MTEKKYEAFRRKAITYLPEDRFRIVDYDPLMRSQGYRGIKLSERDEYKSAILVVYVDSAEEISKLLQLAQELSTPISVRQATGSYTPDIPRREPLGSVVLDLRSMKDIRLNLDDGYVEIGPSVTFRELNEFLVPHGYTYPTSVVPVTWGSLVGMNTSGQLIEPHSGKPGDFVMGLQVVLPYGEIIETGTRTIRKACGPDLTRLFIGGQALFGIITLLRLRLVRSPREVARGVAIFDSVRSLGEAVRETHWKGAPIARTFDFMDDRYLRLLGAFEVFRGSIVMVEMDGEAPGSAQWKLDILFDVLKEKGAMDTKPLDQDEWDDLLRVRYSHQDRLDDQDLLLLMGEVIDSPLATLAELLVETRNLQLDLCVQYPGLDSYYFGHIGALSFHPAFAAPLSWPYEKHKDVAEDIRKKLVEIKIKHQAGVSEQGVFPHHKDWFIGTYGETNYDLIRKIKSVFDPSGLYNPGRL